MPSPIATKHVVKSGVAGVRGNRPSIEALKSAEVVEEVLVELVLVEEVLVCVDELDTVIVEA